MDAASIGEVRDPRILHVVLSFGHKDRGLIHRTTREVIGEDPLLIAASTQEDVPSPIWQWDNYRHSWECNAFNQCHSHLYWNAFCKDKRDGKEIIWDVVEVAASNSTVPFDQKTIGNVGYYQHLQGALAHFGVDWQKGGRDHDFQTGAKCWHGDYWWFWEFHSHA